MEQGNTRLQFIAALSATMAYFVAGTFVGWSSPAIEKLQAGEDTPLNITEVQGSWVAAFLSVGNVFAPLPTGYVVDVAGRKPTLALTALPFLASWLMVTFASSVAELYVSRFLAGLAIGVAVTVSPIYVGEIAEDHIRGALSTLFQVMVNLGTLFGYSVGPYASYFQVAVVSSIFPVLFFLSFVWMPETPYFLLARNRRSDAEKSLMRLRGKTSPESVKEEIYMMTMLVEMQTKKKGSFRDLLGSSGNMKVLAIVLGLIVTQHFSAIVPMTNYVTGILVKSDSAIDANISVIIFGAVQLAVSVVSSGMVDKVGRRPLLLLSCTGCAVSLAVEGLYFYLSQHHLDSSKPIDWLPLTFLIIYIVTYTLGLGPLPWAIAAEIFPGNVKGVAIAVVSTVNASFAVASIQLFYVIEKLLGTFLAFWIFAGCCAVATVMNN